MNPSRAIHKSRLTYAVGSCMIVCASLFLLACPPPPPSADGGPAADSRVSDAGPVDTGALEAGRRVDATATDAALPDFCAAPNYAQQVIDVQYGSHAGFGQEAFPENVLGPPAGLGSHAAQARPDELLSLGEGGQITLKMGRRIVDGPGPDFLIFENMMYWGDNPDDAYTEAAVVDVSQDGVSWTRFHFDFVIDGPTGPQGLPDTVPENFIGFAGIEPSIGNCDPNLDGDYSDAINPTDPTLAGGDAFDLAELGLNWVAYVRIVDTGHAIRNPGSEMYDDDGDLINDGGNLLAPWQGIQGFDLDAVAVVNGGLLLAREP